MAYCWFDWEDNTTSVNSINTIKEPRKPWTDYRVGESIVAKLPQIQGLWRAEIVAISESKKELETEMKARQQRQAAAAAAKTSGSKKEQGKEKQPRQAAVSAKTSGSKKEQGKEKQPRQAAVSAKTSAPVPVSEKGKKRKLEMQKIAAQNLVLEELIADKRAESQAVVATPYPSTEAQWPQGYSFIGDLGSPPSFSDLESLRELKEANERLEAENKQLRAALNVQNAQEAFVDGRLSATPGKITFLKNLVQIIETSGGQSKRPKRLDFGIIEVVPEQDVVSPETISFSGAGSQPSMSVASTYDMMPQPSTSMSVTDMMPQPSTSMSTSMSVTDMMPQPSTSMSTSMSVTDMMPQPSTSMSTSMSVNDMMPQPSTSTSVNDTMLGATTIPATSNWGDMLTGSGSQPQPSMNNTTLPAISYWEETVTKDGIPKVELVSGMRVFLSSQQLSLVMRLGSNPRRMTTALLDAFFTREVLAVSSAKGQRKAHNASVCTKALPSAIISCIKEYVLRQFKNSSGTPCIGETEFNTTINTKCATSRRSLKS